MSEARFLFDWKKLIYVTMGALVLLIPAFFNRYPLVYFDTGVYLEMAVSLEPSFHRSIGYPLFIRIFSLLTSTWPVVFVQAMMVSWLLFQLIARLSPARPVRMFLILTSLLVFATPLGWYVSQLMPDVFTLILALAVVVFIAGEKKHLTDKILLSFVIFISLIVHLSHPAILVLVLLSLLVASGLFRQIRFDFVAFRLLVLLLVGSVLFQMTYNAVWGKGFTYSPGSNVFLTASIAEMGILQLYLEENCTHRTHYLCNYFGDLPRETGGFLWAPDSPVNEHPGGWKGMNNDCEEIVEAYLFHPRYAKWFAFGALKAWFKQMAQIDLGGGLQYAYGENSPPFWPINTHFKMEVNEYLNSMQQKGDLPLGFFKAVNYVSLFVAVIIVLMLQSRVQHGMFPLIAAAFLGFYVFNAAVTGILANVYERLQARMLPLVMVYCFLLVVIYIEQRTKTATSKH
ncbi:MAG: hypothetical protein Kow0075_14250 [Salibacteraceae bacterium]